MDFVVLFLPFLKAFGNGIQGLGELPLGDNGDAELE